jgi:hypothetical protein
MEPRTEPREGYQLEAKNSDVSWRILLIDIFV